MSTLLICFFSMGMASALFMLFCACSIMVMIIRKDFKNKRLADNLKIGMTMGGLLFAVCMFASHETRCHDYQSELLSLKTKYDNNVYPTAPYADSINVGDHIMIVPDFSKENADYYKAVQMSPCLLLGGITKYINLPPQKLEDWANVTAENSPLALTGFVDRQSCRHGTFHGHF